MARSGAKPDITAYAVLMGRDLFNTKSRYMRYTQPSINEITFRPADYGESGAGADPTQARGRYRPSALRIQYRQVDFISIVQRIERWSTNPEVRGSNPRRDA